MTEAKASVAPSLCSLPRGGASVVVTGRTESKIKETVQLIEKADGKGLAVTCDVRKEDQVKAALQKTKETLRATAYCLEQCRRR